MKPRHSPHLWKLAALVLVALVLVWAVASPPWTAAFAQSTDGLRIVVLDVNQILRDSDPVRALRRDIENKRSVYQTELRKQEDELRAADQELKRQLSILSAEARAQKRKELEVRAADLQRVFLSRQRDLERTFSQGIGKVRKVLIEVSKEMALERNLDIIIQKASVVLTVRDLDITAEVLKRVNERLPSVTVPPN